MAIVSVSLRAPTSPFCPLFVFPDIQMHICNREHYGYLPVPLKPQQMLDDDADGIIHMLIEAMGKLDICNSQVIMLQGSLPLGFCEQLFAIMLQSVSVAALHFFKISLY